MKIYNYNNSENEFVQESEARENPLEVGKYLIPAFATEIEPLEIKEGFAICFNETNNAWEYIEDNRGTLYHNVETKEEFICYYLGAIKENHKVGSYELTTEELAVQAIAEYKASRIQAVNNIKVTTEAGNTFDGDETSQTRMVRAASLMDDEEVTNWVLADNSVIEVSKAELMEAAKLAGQEQTRLWIKE